MPQAKFRHKDIENWVMDGIQTSFAIEVFDEDGAPFKLTCPCGWHRNLIGEWPNDSETRFHFQFCPAQAKHRMVLPREI